ncbi:hypothetical protein DPEC_G00162920 [Dallia pectoralis]|uniref:Uncharacterized protein n=1 Tax=Dallia pectoralis TaxID=75939 RepID=A0ACC2GGZ5_DALPE|nr:hypothetical protein DPEC_G00162920 [Dallia pectoralis]
MAIITSLAPAHFPIPGEENVILIHRTDKDPAPAGPAPGGRGKVMENQPSEPMVTGEERIPWLPIWVALLSCLFNDCNLPQKSERELMK